MVNETLKTINDFLKAFNSTFEVEAKIVYDGDEKIADGLKISGFKPGSDPTQFIASMYDIFNTIVSSMSEDHELIYDEKIGLVIARKIVKTDYKIEEFD